MKKRLGIWIALFVCLLTLTCLAATSGTCGANLTWNYNTTTATLIISGTGDMMNNYDSNGYRTTPPRGQHIGIPYTLW